MSKDVPDEIEKIELSDDEAAKSPSEFDPDTHMRIRIGVNVSPYKRGDEMTVERDNPFFAGLVDQRLAEEVV